MRTNDVPSLSDLALSSLADCLESHYAPVGSLSCVPTREAQLLLQVVAERLSTGDGSDGSDGSAPRHVGRRGAKQRWRRGGCGPR